MKKEFRSRRELNYSIEKPITNVDQYSAMLNGLNINLYLYIQCL